MFASIKEFKKSRIKKEPLNKIRGSFLPVGHTQFFERELFLYHEMIY